MVVYLRIKRWQERFNKIVFKKIWTTEGGVCDISPFILYRK